MSTNAGNINQVAGSSSSAESNFSASKLLLAPFLKTALPFMAMLTLLAFATLYYQGWAAWAHGLDATTAEFEKYWMNLFYAETVIIWGVALSAWTWLWVTRDRNAASGSITPTEEVRRYMVWIGIIACYVLALYYAASFFAEQDASWHQAVVRDTAFTPTHIVLFYGWFPIFIGFGGAMFFYAMTRLPVYAKRLSLMVTVAVLGPFMVLPNVAFNEWGHAFWISEEIFSLPLHWGFVVFGWAALAFGGLLVQILNRLMEIVPQAANEGS
ncbi:MAG: methane monooxygenase/ammonia monooxygenase subunit C [Piscirickettsiaceae bacterium]|nr:MAG: methane monooxygenase/ammonia monooxygenase subunit C [Piscirickettsiaceae bacterium]